MPLADKACRPLTRPVLCVHDLSMHDSSPGDAAVHLDLWVPRRYRLVCKRPCFHDDYLAAFNRPGVTLIDTAGQGIEGFTEHGVVALGQEHELDLIVFATGFETGWTTSTISDVGPIRRTTEAQGFQVYGRDGLNLGVHLAAGPRTLNSIQTRGKQAQARQAN